jgi:hypothetical protein
MSVMEANPLKDIDLDSLAMDEAARAARWRVIQHEQRRKERLWEVYRRSIESKNRSSLLSRLKKKLLRV